MLVVASSIKRSLIHACIHTIVFVFILGNPSPSWQGSRIRKCHSSPATRELPLAASPQWVLTCYQCPLHQNYWTRYKDRGRGRENKLEGERRKERNRRKHTYYITGIRTFVAGSRRMRRERMLGRFANLRHVCSWLQCRIFMKVVHHFTKCILGNARSLLVFALSPHFLAQFDSIGHQLRGLDKAGVDHLIFIHIYIYI